MTFGTPEVSCCTSVVAMTPPPRSPASSAPFRRIYSRPMYSRDEVKALTDKVLNMTRADGAEVEFSGGERAGTRWANSTITVNLVQLDQQLSVTVRLGQKTGSASTREFDDDSLKAIVEEATDAAKAARDNPNLQPLNKGPQNYIPIEAAI